MFWAVLFTTTLPSLRTARATTIDVYVELYREQDDLKYCCSLTGQFCWRYRFRIFSSFFLLVEFASTKHNATYEKCQKRLLLFLINRYRPFLTLWASPNNRNDIPMKFRDTCWSAWSGSSQLLPLSYGL